MALTLNGNAAFTPRVSETTWGPLSSGDGDHPRAECVQIALVNNMPDAALEETEYQFLELLTAAAGEMPVRVQLYSLPEIARSERAQQHMSGLYADFRDLASRRYDALIITGTEPHQLDVRREAYWHTLTELFDWAEHNTISTILSCLAAHASVVHSDGIERRQLSDKRLGVFEERKVSDHLLTAGSTDIMRIPHSRWNELREDDLTSSGYTVLTKSKEAGPGFFIKQRRKSLFVHVQGHPEYAAKTLLKEYRRDIRRFLRRERESYPPLPHGYFGSSAVTILTEFRDRALSDRREDILINFPDAVVAETLQNGWHAAGANTYRNWLRYLISGKVNIPERSMAAASCRKGIQIWRKQCMAP